MTRTATPNESDLIGRLRDSDQEAFRLLFEQHQPTLFRFILYHARDRDAAHEIVQETFLRVWDHRGTLRPELPFLAYLFRISRNILRDRMKHLVVQRKFEQEMPAEVHAPGEDLIESLHVQMLQERVSEIVRTKLPPKCREVFLLSRMEMLSNAEISERMGISPKTVENQITRALKILRRHLR